MLSLVARESMLHERHATGRSTVPERAAVCPGDEVGGAQPTQH